MWKPGLSTNCTCTAQKVQQPAVHTITCVGASQAVCLWKPGCQVLLFGRPGLSPSCTCSARQPAVVHITAGVCMFIRKGSSSMWKNGLSASCTCRGQEAAVRTTTAKLTSTLPPAVAVPQCQPLCWFQHQLGTEPDTAMLKHSHNQSHTRQPRTVPSSPAVVASPPS